jgi:hypothetical protein
MFRHRPSCLEGPRSYKLGRRRAKTMPGNDSSCQEKDSVCGTPPQAASIRTELVERIRQAIAEGRYDTPERWEAALHVLLQRLHEA